MFQSLCRLIGNLTMYIVCLFGNKAAKTVIIVLMAPLCHTVSQISMSATVHHVQRGVSTLKEVSTVAAMRQDTWLSLTVNLA